MMVKALIALVVSLSVILPSANADPAAQEAPETPPAALEGGQWYRASVALDAVQEIPFLLWLPSESGEGIIRTGAQDQRFPFKKLDGWVLYGSHIDHARMLAPALLAPVSWACDAAASSH